MKYLSRVSRGLSKIRFNIFKEPRFQNLLKNFSVKRFVVNHIKIFLFLGPKNKIPETAISKQIINLSN